MKVDNIKPHKIVIVATCTFLHFDAEPTVFAQEDADSMVDNVEGPSRPTRTTSTSSQNSSIDLHVLPKELDEKVATLAIFLLSVRRSPSLPRNIQIILVSRLKALSRVNTTVIEPRENVDEQRVRWQHRTL